MLGVFAEFEEHRKRGRFGVPRGEVQPETDGALIVLERPNFHQIQFGVLAQSAEHAGVKVRRIADCLQLKVPAQGGEFSFTVWRASKGSA